MKITLSCETCPNKFQILEASFKKRKPTQRSLCENCRHNTKHMSETSRNKILGYLKG